VSKLLNIAIRAGRRDPMQQLETAHVSCEFGVNRDFRGKPGKRQITVLNKQSWDLVCEIIGKPLDWKTRRANLLVESLSLENSTGSVILIGEMVLEITQETDPCNRMDEAEPGLFNALKDNWRGGVCCRVLMDGDIKIGDAVIMLTREEYESRK